MTRNLLARLFGKNRGRAASSDYRKRQRACLKVERLEERAMMALVVPAFSSLPSAPAKLYLDFDGNYESSWNKHDFGSAEIKTFNNINTPAFDLDGNANDFSIAEQDAIKKIWQRVAEDYAPFNIDVTTVNPVSFNNKQALHVVIGGFASNWYQTDVRNESRDATTGTSSASSFTDNSPNVVYVFSGSIREKANTPWSEVTFDNSLFGVPLPRVITTYATDGDGRRIQIIPTVANTISHEAGHAFGLRHQTGYDSAGNPSSYSSGSSSWTPIMGDNLASDRTKWSNGAGQDDMAVLAGPANGFDYRPQEALRTLAVQSPYWLPQATSGVISKMAEGDLYMFTTSGGPTQISVRVAAEGSNLDATLTLWRYTPWAAPYMAVVASADAAPTSTDQGLNASYYNASLTGGMYYVMVGSHGTYGDVGQYTIVVTSGFQHQASIPPLSGASYFGGGNLRTAYSSTDGASAGFAMIAQDLASSAAPDDHARGLMSLKQLGVGALGRRGHDWPSASGGQRRADKTVAANFDDPALTLLPANAGTIGGLVRAGLGKSCPHDAVFSLPNDFLTDALVADLAVL